MLLLLACVPSTGPVPTPAFPEDTGVASCPVLGQWPQGGSVTPPSGPWHVLLAREAAAEDFHTEAEGELRVIGQELIFQPASLAWDTRYEFTVEGCSETSFRTPPEPAASLVEVETRWQIDLLELSVALPDIPPGEPLTPGEPREVVLEVLSVDEGVTLGVAHWVDGVQEDCASLSELNRLDGAELIADFDGEVALLGAVASGGLVAVVDGDAWGAGVVSLEMDERELGYEICSLMGLACQPCSSDGAAECVRLVVGDVLAEPTDRELDYCSE